MSPNAVLFSLFVVSLAFGIGSAAAPERVALSPRKKNAEATHVVTGLVRGVYSREARTKLYGPGTLETRYIIEIEIESVDKGSGFTKGDLVYARSWKLKKRGGAGKPQPGPSGHFLIPAEGDRVRAFLVHGPYPPTGQKDRGYAVVYPNGIDRLEKKE